MKRLCFVILALISWLTAMSSANIFGNAKEYAGNDIVFYKYADRITYMKEQLFVLKIDEDGGFNVSVNVDEITYVFGEFGIYHAYFYLEPDASYELLLPPYEERKMEDILNPFFSPEEVHIGIRNLKQTDLNYLILDFDYFYDRYLSIYLEDVYFKGLDSNVDTFIVNINENYKNIDNQYFKVYKDCRIANLKNIATQGTQESLLSLVYFARNPVFYDNPAYMDLFNNIYNSYFDKYLITPKGNLLRSVIDYGHSISRMHKLLSEEVEFRSNAQFREMVILKSINDAFSNRNFEWKPLLQILDSIIIITEFPKHKEIAQRVADYTLLMSANTVAPVFALPNAAGDTLNISDYRSKYVYLQFANTQSYSTKMEFGLLKKIYERYKGVCTFITVLTDSDIDKAERYIKKNKLEWNFVYAPVNSPVLSKYNVMAYPTYYLIDPAGMLKMSPAPSPTENFETYLFNIIEKEKVKGNH